jgi:hypothetical protein
VVYVAFLVRRLQQTFLVQVLLSQLLPCVALLRLLLYFVVLMGPENLPKERGGEEEGAVRRQAGMKKQRDS